MPEPISPLDMQPEEPDGTGEERREGPTGDVERVRELVLRAHPDVVPELVSGETVDAVLSSVDAARAAYARLRDAWAERTPAKGDVQVPAGGGAPMVVPADRLPAAEKIRRGLASAVRAQKG